MWCTSIVQAIHSALLYGCVKDIASCAKVWCCIAYFGLVSRASVCMLTSLHITCKIVNGCFFLSSLYAPLTPHIPTLSPSSHPLHLTSLHTSHATSPHPLTPHASSHPTPLTLPHTSHSLTSHTPHTLSHLTPPHTSHSTPLTEYIRRRHNHIYGPRTPPSSTTPRRQPRVGPHPKPREGHCRKLKEPRIYPQGKLNYHNLLPMTHCHWCSLLRPLVAWLLSRTPTHPHFRNLHSCKCTTDNIIGAGTLIWTSVIQLSLIRNPPNNDIHRYFAVH